MSDFFPCADWSKLREEPDVALPLPPGPGGERVTLLLRRIPAGSFFMGARGEGTNEEPRHRVVLPHDFYLGKFAVTQAEWRAVAALSPALTRSPGLDPSDKRNKGDRRPVTDVSWDDVTEWCGALTRWLGAERGRWPQELRRGGWQPQLPTEAEWEYACRAGTETDYHGGDGEAALAEVAWFGEDWNTGAVHDGGQKQSNDAGLHDMHGNVWEWCRDAYRSDAYRRRIDGVVAPMDNAPMDAKDADGDRQQRVVRGGSWGSPPGGCRSACRIWGLPVDRFGFRGFRLCLAPGPAFAKASEGKPAGGKAEKRESEKAVNPTEKAKPGPGDGGRGTSPESDGRGGAGARGTDIDLAHEAFAGAAGRKIK